MQQPLFSYWCLVIGSQGSLYRSLLCLCSLFCFQCQNGVPAAQVDTTLLVDVGDLDHDGIAYRHHIFHTLHTLGVQLGDVHQTFLARCDLHEGTKVHQAGDLALVDGTDLRILYNGLDGKDGTLCVLLIHGGHKDVTVLLHIDLAVAGGADVLNDLAALADNVLDLIGGDHHAEHLGCPAAQLLTRLGDHRLDDLVQDIQTTLAALLECLGNDVVGQTVDLDIHLDGGDALAGAAYLKVHIAVEVLHALNVQHGHPAITLGDQTAGDARHRRLDGHTGVHKRQRGTADGCLRGGTVGGKHLGDAADGVGELLQRGQHRHQSTLRQSAVTDLPATGAAGSTCLAYRVGREVIVVDIPLGLLVGQIVHELVVLGTAQSAGGEHLRLTTGEHAGAVDPGQDAHFCSQRTDLVDATTVHTLALIQQPAAHHELLHLVAHQIQIRSGQVRVLLRNAVHDGQQGSIPDVLVVGVHGCLKVVQILVLDGVVQVHIQTHHLEVDLGLAPLCHDAVDELDDLLDLHMGGLDGIKHGVLVHLVSACLDHDDLVHGGGNGKSKVALAALLLGGVQHDLAVHQTHLHAADGTVPGDVGHSSHQRCTDHTGDLGAAIRVKAHDGHGDAHVVAHLLGEQRAHGAVHHTAGEDGTLAGATLTAHKAAGNTSCSVELLLILHIQGEEIHPFPGLGAHDHVAHHAGLAVADQRTGIGQSTHLAHFYLERAACQHGLVDLEVVKGLFAGTKFDCHLFCLLIFTDLSKRRRQAHHSNKSSVRTPAQALDLLLQYAAAASCTKSKGQAPLRYLPSV